MGLAAKKQEPVSKQQVLDLLVAFAFIDSELHENEIQALQEICKGLSIPDEELNLKIEEYKSYEGKLDYEELCYKALLPITSKETQDKLASLLCYIATSDRLHHEKELKFINALRDSWGVDVSIARSLRWDEDQKLVVFADYEEKIICHAGPGMGKTAVACARVQNLIEQGVEASNIWMLSFTRTAVKEIRDRISSFAGQNLSSLGVKVATIDSQSWQIRYGLTDDEIDNLFGDYNKNIEDVVKLFDTHYNEMHEFFDNFEHVIIDEAQDITGPRAELILKILKVLNPNCGFTIFADPAQAIYNFTDDRDGFSHEATKDFLSLVKHEFSQNFQEIELKTIHRTNNPKLVKLIEDLRLDIYVNDNIDFENYQERGQFIKSHADRNLGEFSSEDIKDNSDTLVLFRKRAEVLRASCYANQDGIPHRIRMSGHPVCIYPWVGYIFYDYTDKAISKSRFLELCEKRSYLFLEDDLKEQDFELWWSLLHKTSGSREDVDVTDLRKKLSRNPPHINLCYSELGASGSIIGTIHASKGREADNVILELPKTIEGKSDYYNYDEESRVLYVGATRAKKVLAVGQGYTKQAYSKSLDTGRAFERSTSSKNAGYILASVEIGMDGDVDDYSFVSKELNQKDIFGFQRALCRMAKDSPTPLRCFLEPEKNFKYTIWTKSSGTEADRPFGAFSESLNYDFFKIAKACTGTNYHRPPPNIDPIYLVGLRTVCKSVNDPNLKFIHEPYSETGIWLAPVIIGYPRCLFPRKSKRRF